LELPTISRLLHPADESDSDGTSEDAEVVGRRVASLNRRSRRRIQQALKTAMTSDCSRRELLEIITVSPKAEAYYRASLTKFVKWSDNLGIRLVTDSDVDSALAKCMTEMYLLGQQSSEGDKLLAGLLHFAPEWGKYGDRSIPRAWRCLKGWRRRCPSRSRRPWPLMVWAMLAWRMAAVGRWDMALFTLLLVCTYMRPGEGLALRKCDLIPPSPGVLKHWSILLFPQERVPSSKTLAKDESLVMDSSYMAWWDRVLPLLKQGKAESRVFAFSYEHYIPVFKQAAAEIGLPDLVPYQARHSGASVDAANHYRTIAEIQRRGRWKTSASVQRYEKHAQLGKSAASLNPRQQHVFAVALDWLESLVLGRRSPEDLPAL
jgi:integrase